MRKIKLAPNFKMQGTGEPGEFEIFLYGPIVPHWGIGALDVAELLDENPGAKRIHLRVCSIGGVTSEGVAIRELLARHPAIVDTTIEGCCMSAATLPPMAGKEVSMTVDSLYMIHDAWTWIPGNADELRKEASVLDKLSQGVAKRYAVFTGGNADSIRTMMREETYFSADEALENGFVTDVNDGASQDDGVAEGETQGEDSMLAAQVNPILAQLFQHAPVNVAKRLGLPANPIGSPGYNRALELRLAALEREREDRVLFERIDRFSQRVSRVQ